MSKIIDWLGVVFGLFVAPPQLYKIITTGNVQDISLFTYIFLVMAMACYLIEAIRIKSKVFITAQSINLITNGIILFYLAQGVLIKKIALVLWSAYQANHNEGLSFYIT
jgi:uncharacterized protein with PQ loop repeat